jgi:GntR family transcriptional regulator
VRRVGPARGAGRSGLPESAGAVTANAFAQSGDDAGTAYNPAMTAKANAGIDTRSYVPYYQQLKQILITEIQQRNEGDLLPSESDLCRTYSVSRTVVRQALDELERDGLVLKIKGKGTFATGRKLNTSFVQYSLGFYDSMVNAGHSVRSKVLASELTGCPVSLAGVLDLNIGDEVIRFDRVRSVDDRPVQVVRATLPSRMFPGFTDLDMTDRSLYQVMRDVYGVWPAGGHRSIEAAGLSAEDARHLGTTPGLPALRIESVTRTAEGAVFEYYSAIYAGDSFKFELEIASP